jgi:hypothetical protein
MLSDVSSISATKLPIACERFSYISEQLLWYLPLLSVTFTYLPDILEGRGRQGDVTHRRVDQVSQLVNVLLQHGIKAAAKRVQCQNTMLRALMPS